jgi:hypothetical protein
MDYFATWLFTNSYSSKNSRSNLRPVGSREFARFLHSPAGRSLLSGSVPHSPQLDAPLQSIPNHESASEVLEQLTAQIIEVFDQLRSERDATPRASAQWHKLTGEMLAYARVTALLESMKCGSPSVSNPDD